MGHPDNLAPLLGFVGDELAKTAGEPGNVVPPKLANRAFNLESVRPSFTAMLNLSMTSVGVLRGIPSPNQLLTS